jgi:hypothetical protein
MKNLAASVGEYVPKGFKNQRHTIRDAIPSPIAAIPCAAFAELSREYSMESVS